MRQYDRSLASGIGVPFLLLFVSVALAPKPLEVLLVHCSHPGDKRPFRPTPWWFLRHPRIPAA